MVTGKTKAIGILGWPVGHSLSPLMQNAAFAAAGLNYVYIPLPVQPVNLDKAVAGLKAMGFVGANVTIPHKIAVMDYLDEIDRSAQMVGAVNTIVIKDNRSIGYNTDAQGFVQSLLTKNVAIAGKKVVLLGAGGAARAVVWGLIEQGAESITIGVRNTAKAQELVEVFSRMADVTVYDWQTQDFLEKLGRCDILVNCTPLGMAPHIEEMPPVDLRLLKPGIAVCDLIYTPALTQFLHSAAGLGHTIINGEGMLVEQGAAAFTLWTGVNAPTGTMYTALEAALAK